MELIDIPWKVCRFRTQADSGGAYGRVDRGLAIGHSGDGTLHRAVQLVCEGGLGNCLAWVIREVDPDVEHRQRSLRPCRGQRLDLVLGDFPLNSIGATGGGGKSEQGCSPPVRTGHVLQISKPGIHFMDDLLRSEKVSFTPGERDDRIFAQRFTCGEILG